VGTGVSNTVSTTSNTNKNATNAQKIACVAAAVATREAALGAAISVHGSAVSAAYTTRATVLAGAYANTTPKAVRAGVKVAWADFTKSIKSANSKWRESRNTAWSTFRSAAKACKAGSDITDSSNSGSETSGQ
jgi:hypothetical protein